MSNKTKKIGMWSLKALAVGLFVFLAVVNVQMVTGGSSVINMDNLIASVTKASADFESPDATYVAPNNGGPGYVTVTNRPCPFPELFGEGTKYYPCNIPNENGWCVLNATYCW